MFSNIVLPLFLVFVFSVSTSRATPIEVGQDLVLRDNRYHLNCSNAPGVVAGYPVSQSDIVLGTDLPQSGSNQQWMKYLWCTANTKTYTFFDFGEMNPYPQGYFNVYEALNQAKVQAHNWILANGDTGFNKDGLDVGWAPNVPNTNVRVFVRDNVGKMTYGILEAALTGLLVAVQNYNKGNYPMVFQINDGAWGEVGIGYIGLIPDDRVQNWMNDKCVYEINADGLKPCSDVEARRVHI